MNSKFVQRNSVLKIKANTQYVMKQSQRIRKASHDLFFFRSFVFWGKCHGLSYIYNQSLVETLGKLSDPSARQLKLFHLQNQLFSGRLGDYRGSSSKLTGAFYLR